MSDTGDGAIIGATLARWARPSHEAMLEAIEADHVTAQQLSSE